MNCSELENINISLDYFNSIKLFGEEIIKYLKGYKQIKMEYIKKLEMFHLNSKNKLTIPEDPKTTHIITEITSKLSSFIEQNIELIKLSSDAFDIKIKELETFIKETSESIKIAQKDSSELSKTYFNSNLEMDKIKNNYIDSLSKTEDIINKYYSNQYKIKEHENGLGQKLNDSDYNSLKEQQKNEINEMNNSIKESKQIESLYANSMSNSTQLYIKFIETNNSIKNKMKNDTCNLSNRIKSLIMSFMLLYKNNHKEPLLNVDSTVKHFNLTDEVKEMEKIICNDYKNDKLLKNISPTNYKLKSLTLLKEVNYMNNDEEDKTNNNNCVNDNIEKKKALIRKNSMTVLEDGFEKMKYITDDSLIKTIKCLFDNFIYIDKEDFNLNIEEKKNKTQQYVLKIIGNMNSYPFNKSGIIAEKQKNPKIKKKFKYKRDELSPEEVQELKELLDNHHNRLIFLQKLNDYRGLGKFYLCKEDFNLLSEMFALITDKIKRDTDHQCAERIIILSETYCREKGKRKIFLQESIKNNDIFKDKNFWEEFLCYSINKHIMQTLERDKKIRENKKETDSKFSNVVFAQLLTLIENMYKFNIDSKIVKEVLEPKISYYRLTESCKSTIDDVITAKEMQKVIDEQEREKEEKEEEDENENVINEENNNDKKEGETIEDDGWEIMDYDDNNK